MSEFDSIFDLRKVGAWIEHLLPDEVHVTFEENEHTITSKSSVRLKVGSIETEGMPYTYFVSGSEVGYRQATQQTSMISVDIEVHENPSFDQAFDNKNPMLLADRLINRMKSQPSQEYLNGLIPGFGLQTTTPIIRLSEGRNGFNFQRAIFTMNFRANQHYLLPYEVHPVESVAGTINAPPVAPGFFLLASESFDETLLPLEWSEGTFEQNNANQVAISFAQPFGGVPLVFLRQAEGAPFDVPYSLLAVDANGFTVDIGLEQQQTWQWYAARVNPASSVNDKGLLTTGSLGLGTAYNVLGVKEGTAFTKFSGETLDTYNNQRFLTWQGTGNFLVMPVAASYSNKTFAAFMSSNTFVSGGFFALRNN